MARQRHRMAAAGAGGVMLGAFCLAGSVPDHASAASVGLVAATMATVQDRAAEAAGLTFDRRYEDGDQTVFEGVTLDADGAAITAEILRLTDAEGFGTDVVTAERIEVEGLRVMPRPEEGEDGERSVVLTIGKLTSEEFSYDRPDDPGEAADDEESRRALARLLSSIAFGESEATDLTVGASGSGSLSIEALEMSAYADGLLGAVEATALVLETGTAGGDVRERVEGALPGFAGTPLGRMMLTQTDRIVIEGVAWGGLDAGGALAALARGEAPGLATPDITMADIVARDEKQYRDGKLASRTGRIALEDVTFEGVVPTGAVLTSTDVTTDFTAFATEQDEAAVEILEARGLDRVEGSARTTYAFSPEAGVASFNSDAQADGLYRFDFSTTLSDIDIETLRGSSEDSEALTLDEMAIVLSDIQALDTLFELAALGSEESAKTLRQQAVGMVTLGGLQGRGFSPRIPSYVAALSAFVGQGGTLTISMTPEGGVGLDALSSAAKTDPADALEAVNLTIEHSE